MSMLGPYSQQVAPVMAPSPIVQRGPAYSVELPRPWAVWLDRRHPEYADYEEHWSFLKQTFVGGPTYLKKNLFRFWREGQGEWTSRLVRAHHYNYARKIVEIMNGYLWQQTPTRQREKLPEPLQVFWEDADRQGHDIDEVMAQEVSPWTSVFGRYYVVVDAPKGTAETKADQQAQRLYPYLSFIAPGDLLDAKIVNGKPEWVLLRERVREDEDPVTSSGWVQERYRLWTRTAWQVYARVDRGPRKGGRIWTPSGDLPDVEARLLDEGEHGLGVVPIVPVDHRTSTSWFVSPSLIWEIAYLDRSIFNHISLLDENLYDTTFSQLRIPWQALPPGVGADPRSERDAAKADALEMATKRAFTYDGTSGTPPEWMAPPPAPAEVLMRRIQQEIDELFRHVSLAGEMATDVSGASGVSKEHDFRKLNKLLSAMADNLQTAENEILDLAAKWLGINPDSLPPDAIDYPENFDVTTLLEELEEIKAMGDASMPELVINQLRKEVVHKYFSKLDPKALEALVKSVDEGAGKPLDVEAALRQIEQQKALAARGAGAGPNGQPGGGGTDGGAAA